MTAEIVAGADSLLGAPDVDLTLLNLETAASSLPCYSPSRNLRPAHLQLVDTWRWVVARPHQANERAAAGTAKW